MSKKYDELFLEGKLRCKTCKLIKPKEEFWKDKSQKRGFDRQCKLCSKARQNREWSKFGSEPGRMYNRLLQLTEGTRSYKNHSRHQRNISKKDFINWYENQDKKCHYCSLNLEEFNEIKNHYNKQIQRTKRFGIDRKNNELPYQVDNIVLCCVICNGLKGYFFDYQTFKELSREYIKPKLSKLLNKYNGNKYE